MKVLFIPSWKENPYQELLAEHVKESGSTGKVKVKHAKQKRLLTPGWILARRIDLVHLHSATRFAEGASGLAALWAALRSLLCLAWLRLRGVKIAWTAHDLHDHDRRFPIADFVFTWALAHLASVIITHGERATQLVRDRYRLHRSDRFVVIPHGPFTRYTRHDVDRASSRRTLGIPDDAFVFLFLGAIRPYKGVVELVEAFRALGDSSARLLIRGRARDSGLERAIESAAASSDGVDFTPAFVPDDEIASLMAACDVAVAPYTSVLTSGSIVLAMSLGRACIAPRLGGIPDVLDESCGILYRPDEPGGLGDALRQAAARRDELPGMGHAALARITAHSWEEVADRTVAAYRRTGAGRTAAGRATGT